MKYLIALAFFLMPLAACEANDPAPAPSTSVEPRDCDQPTRDETGRPVDLC